MKTKFKCISCGSEFNVSESVLQRYPGWTPKKCLDCRDRGKGSSQRGKKTSRSTSRTKRSSTATQDLTLAQVIRSFSSGPKDGLFTDGSARPNPGPGGWGAVYVKDDQVIEQKHGYEQHTTNNRMELMALREGCNLVPPGTQTDVYTDSELCFKTITQWASSWQAMGWRRKSGPIKNLELVKEVYEIFKRRPELTLHWIRAHDESKWNEYADSLATAWCRNTL